MLCLAFPEVDKGENTRKLTELPRQECSRLAFAKMGRSLQASDLTDEVHTAFLNLFGEEEDDGAAGAKL